MHHMFQRHPAAPLLKAAEQMKPYPRKFRHIPQRHPRLPPPLFHLLYGVVYELKSAKICDDGIITIYSKEERIIAM